MKRRLLAATAAIVLLVAGTAVLLGYVRGADQRALDGVRTVQVLVADELIPEGTPASEITELVRTELVPAKTALDGRVIDLADLRGEVTATELLPGEQLLSARFVEPGALQAAGTVEVPAGLQEISVQLEPQRAVGGRLAAGDHVAIFVSLVFQDGTSNTHAVLHDVLVTQVQGAPAPVDPAAEGDDTATASAGTPLPSSSLMVTLAVTARQAEPVIFGVEHGTLWLSLEPDGADTRGTDVINQGNVYGKSYS